MSGGLSVLSERPGTGSDSGLGLKATQRMSAGKRIVNPLSEAGWNDAVLSTPDPSIFHTSNWTRVLHASYGYEPAYFTLAAEDGFLAAIPMMDVKSVVTGRRGVSLPFTDFCEPGIVEGVPFQDLFDWMISVGVERRWKYLELRGGERFMGGALPWTSFFGHRLALCREESRIYSGLKDTVKRNIKKARAGNVEMDFFGSLSSCREFYRLHCMTRRLKGLPPQPWHFFARIHDHVIQPGYGFVALAAVHGAVIAGAIFFHFGKNALFKFGASDRRFQDLRANDLVIWESIRRCCGGGFRSLCFGRTEPQNEGLRRFKKGWGAREYPIRYYRFDLNQRTFVTGGGPAMPILEHLFRRMPMAVLRLAGEILYRHVA